MNYFSAIAKRAEELSAQAEERMKDKPFVSCPDMADTIWREAARIFQAAKAANGGEEDWSSIPDWVGSAIDGHVPYIEPPHNGSLYYALGWSMMAQEHNLRVFYEAVLAGENPEDADFLPCLAEKEIVARYAAA